MCKGPGSRIWKYRLAGIGGSLLLVLGYMARGLPLHTLIIFALKKSVTIG